MPPSHNLPTNRATTRLLWRAVVLTTNPEVALSQAAGRKPPAFWEASHAAQQAIADVAARGGAARYHLRRISESLDAYVEVLRADRAQADLPDAWRTDHFATAHVIWLWGRWLVRELHYAEALASPGRISASAFRRALHALPDQPRDPTGASGQPPVLAQAQRRAIAAYIDKEIDEQHLASALGVDVDHALALVRGIVEGAATPADRTA